MKHEHYEKNMRKFVESIRDSYMKNSYISSICSVKEYDSKTDKKYKFFQFPISITMEKNEFSGKIDNTLLGYQLGEIITFVEFNYIISELKKPKVKKIELEKFNDEILLSKLGNLPKDFVPRYLLIPIQSDYYHCIHKLVDRGIAKYEQNKLNIYFENHKINVIWSSEQRRFDKIYLLGDKAISWIYKTTETIEPLFDAEEYKYGFDKEDSKVSVIYKEMKKEKEIYFIARSVGLAKVNHKKVREYYLNK